jgi:hypothetical protein
VKGKLKQTSRLLLKIKGSKYCLQKKSDGGAEGIRTPDPHNAIVVLYQLSYDPIQF